MNAVEVGAGELGDSKWGRCAPSSSILLHLVVACHLYALFMRIPCNLVVESVRTMDVRGDREEASIGAGFDYVVDAQGADEADSS